MDEHDDRDGLGGLLRATFRAREDEAVARGSGAGSRDGDAGAQEGTSFDIAGLAAAVRHGYARRVARRRQVMAVSAVGVLAAGGSTALALARHGSGVQRPATMSKTAATKSGGVASASSPGSPTSAQSSSSAGPLPGATRAWSSHGLQVRVPAAWQANQLQCGTPIKSTVVIGGGANPLCELASPPPVDVVTFGSANPSQLVPSPVMHATAVDGVAAQVGTVPFGDGRTITELVVPSLDVSVTVESQDPKLVAGIVATAQLVDADANGCASRAGSVEPAGPPARPGAQSTMVPGTPVKAVVCHYGTSFFPGKPLPDGPTLLTNGSEIPKDQLGGLTTLLNTLKPGLTTWHGLAGACPPAARDGYLFRFSYASGAPVDVYLHTSDCDHIGFSNGAVTGYIPQKFVDGVHKFMPDMAFEVPSDAVK